MTGPVLDIQQPDIGNIAELYEVDASAITGLAEVLRFVPAPLIADSTAPAPQPVVWRGNTYEPRACQSEGWTWDGQGPLPQPTLTLGNTDRAVSALCIAYNDLQGAIVTRHRVPIKYLDGMPDADPDVEFDPDLFLIDQKTLQNKMVVTFNLGAAIDIQGRLIPGRQVVQGYCPFRPRFWDGTQFVYNQGMAACPYTGDKIFDAAGHQTSAPAEEVFTKRLKSCCAIRFTGDLPFGGFPGAAQFQG